MSKIAVVVPTIRPDKYQEFLSNWESLFEKHAVDLVTVQDGPSPRLFLNGVEKTFSYDEDLIFNFNDGVRNLGFLYVAKELPEAEYIISLDDDVAPWGDTIEDHLQALNMIAVYRPGWLSTMIDRPPRGLPYQGRKHHPVYLSHGTWYGVADVDASEQLTGGTAPGAFTVGHIPPGSFFPLCAMNFAFRRALLPYIYQAPMGPKLKDQGLPQLDRFADIWGGVAAKVYLDAQGLAAVTGLARVIHARASDPFVNLQKEAPGVALNENFSSDFIDYKTLNEYVIFYKSLLERWARECR